MKIKERGDSTGAESESSSVSTRPLRILMVAAEAAPFVKVGGLGDVIGTLPRRLVQLGLEVAVVLPYYPEVGTRGHRPLPTGREVVCSHGGISRRSPVLEEVLDGVRYWFIQEDDYFGREGVYGPPGGEYPDSAERFSYLGRTALEASKVMEFSPDVLHCHDWHASLTPLYLEEAGMGRVLKILTIHNLAYQGVFNIGVLPSLGLPPRVTEGPILFQDGNVNFLKAGIVSADRLTTVSPTYAAEIQTPDQGWGLDGILRHRKRDIYGILNGIDFDEWDPGSDPSLRVPFSAADIESRRRNRDYLLAQLGLHPGPQSPVFAFIGRLVHQKGADLIASVLPDLVRHEACIIVLGTGDPEIERSLKEISTPFNGKVSLTIGFDESLARRIYGGADFFLMPSRFEPCGLGQMIAMRYGSVPIVRATGGLKDTVKDLESDSEGTGIVFKDADPESLLAAAGRAAGIFRNGRLGEIIPRIMELDNSWLRSARRFARLYSEAARKEGK